MIVYLDMDGVLADFDDKVMEVFGIPFDDFPGSSKESWAALKSRLPRIYRELKKMPDADHLVDSIFEIQKEYGFEVQILTGIPRVSSIPNCVEDKKEWLTQHYPDLAEVFNIGPYSRDKQNWAKPGDVLIDDRGSNIEQWINKGGTGILHTDAITSVNELLNILYLPPLQ